MAFEVSYSLENEQQFWDGECARNPTTALHRLTRATELDDIVSAHCQSHEAIDNSLRSFLNVTTNYKCTPSPRTAPTSTVDLG
jgi:hypothetical protein